MSTFIKFITITSTALLMAAPLYATKKLAQDPDPDKDSCLKKACVETTSVQETLGGIAADNKKQILYFASQHTNPSVLRLVCQEWKAIIDKKDNPNNNQGGNLSYSSIGPVWKECMKASWGVVTSEDEKIFQIILNGELVYRPDPHSYKGMIKLKILDFAHPFKGTFDLSACGDTASYFRITKNLSDFFAVENENPKGNILIAPRFLIDKYISTTATQFAQILERWNKDKAPVGIFWRWSDVKNLSLFDYLTSATLSDIASKNLYDNWRAARSAAPIHRGSFPSLHRQPPRAYYARAHLMFSFRVRFVN